MNTKMTIDFDTAAPSRDPGAYRVSFAESGEAAHALRHEEPVHNGVSRYTAVCQEFGQAVAAALQVVGRPCTILEVTQPFAPSQYAVRHRGHPARNDGAWIDGAEYRVLGYRSQKGDWIAR